MLRSSIGSKFIMAVSGLILFVFVLIHMLGNLQIYLGPKALNDYAQMLHDMPGPLWAARIGLLLAFAIHIASAFRISRENREARPIRYQYEDTVEASFASRTMLLSGIVILLFTVYHIAHFTLQWTGLPSEQFVEDLGDGATRAHVYNMVVAGFSIWYVSLLYIVAQLFLGLHLCHGVSSMFQTLGLNNKRCEKVVGLLGPIAAVIVVAGNISIPLAVFVGLLRPVGS